MVAELWDGRERLEGVMRPLPGPHAQKAVKTAWMIRFYGNQEKWTGGFVNVKSKTVFQGQLIWAQGYKACQ